MGEYEEKMMLLSRRKYYNSIIFCFYQMNCDSDLSLLPSGRLYALNIYFDYSEMEEECKSNNVNIIFA